MDDRELPLWTPAFCSDAAVTTAADPFRDHRTVERAGETLEATFAPALSLVSIER